MDGTPDSSGEGGIIPPVDDEAEDRWRRRRFRAGTTQRRKRPNRLERPK